MLRLRRTANQKMYVANLVQKSYRIRSHGTEGYVLLTKNRIRVIEERSGTFNRVLELPYEHIAAITVETRHRITLVDTEGRTHNLIALAGVTAYTIEADLKSRIAPLDYPQLG